MNKRDVILVGTGAVLGYLLVGYYKSMNNKKEKTEPTQVDIVDQAKIDSCNKEVADMMAMSKFTSGTDLEKVKKDAFDACMGRTA